MDLTPDLFTFTWPVPDKGFVWDHGASPDPHLQPAEPHRLRQSTPPFLVASPASTCRVMRKPLEDGTLFLEFAARPPTEEEILKFANRYGFLGFEVPLVPKGGQGEIPLGESLATWQMAIREMNTYVHMWQLLANRETGKLGRLIVWSPDGSAVLFYPGGPEEVARGREGKRPAHGVLLIAGKHRHADLFATWKVGDVVAPARLLLLEAVNERLRGAASPYLILGRKDSFQGSIRPVNLVGAMWVQFYRAIVGETKYRRCEICQGWMDVTHARRDKRQHDVCGTRVRVAKYRKRIREKQASE